MCGIFGFITNSPRSSELSRSELDTGLKHILHRGPDGSGTWVSPNGQIGLGHVRLSIIDLETGEQPMKSNDGRYILIFNGEIYNYLELKNELGKELFRTKSDTEVVLRAYERWGPRCVNRLRGMFSIAIWDIAEQKLFLARDRFGIKPLYWAKTLNGFYFASEIKALLPFLEHKQVNDAALSDYFTFQFCFKMD